MLNYACEAGKAGDGNAAAFTAGGKQGTYGSWLWSILAVVINV